MSLWLNGIAPIFVGLCLGARLVQANEYLYQDDDLLCGPGFTPEMYHQRLQQHSIQQKASSDDYQRAMINGMAAELKAKERINIARKARFEKEARRRIEIIARRKAMKSSE